MKWFINDLADIGVVLCGIISYMICYIQYIMVNGEEWYSIYGMALF